LADRRTAPRAKANLLRYLLREGSDGRLLSSDEVRAVADEPWTVFEGADLRGRFRNGNVFEAKGASFPPLPPPAPDPLLRPDLSALRRFDYPLDYDPTAQPVRASDVAMRFHLSGTDPAIGTQVAFNATSGVVPVVIRDPTVLQGLATAAG